METKRMKFWRHPDGTDVASFELSDGRMLRVVGADARKELYKTLFIMLGRWVL